MTRQFRCEQRHRDGACLGTATQTQSMPCRCEIATRSPGACEPLRVHLAVSHTELRQVTSRAHPAAGWAWSGSDAPRVADAMLRSMSEISVVPAGNAMPPSASGSPHL